MGRKPLFDKTEVLEVINRWVARHGVPPTVRELADALRVGSVRTVVRYLRLLEDEGAIRRWPGARGLKPLKQSALGIETIAVPIVGEAPAGPLMTAQENIEGFLRLPKTLLRSSNSKHFLLHVRGDSMNRAAIGGKRIETGDLILVRQQSTAESGDVVVALIDGEATIKRLLIGQGYALLKPESSNSVHQPIMIDARLSVLGVVEQVFKKGSDLLRVVED